MEIEDENRRELPAERAEQTTDRQPTSQPDRQIHGKDRGKSDWEIVSGNGWKLCYWTGREERDETGTGTDHLKWGFMLINSHSELNVYQWAQLHKASWRIANKSPLFSA